MYKLITRLKGKQVRFFTCYYVVVIILILWSYFEGVGDVSGIIIYFDKGQNFVSKFKAGYFSSLNYGIYYLFVLPLFLRSVFSTYFTAEKLTNLVGEKDDDLKIRTAINRYSSTIIDFTRRKISVYTFIILFLFFCCQNLVVERGDYKSLSLGWVQGLSLKNMNTGRGDTITIKKKFYFRNNTDSTYVISRLDSVRVTNLGFAFGRKPGETEFVIFIAFAKLFFSFFTAIVFFFNINILYGLLKFFKEENKKFLFKSSQFVQTMDTLISHISLAGFFLTIFLFFRYITNAQKGSFKPFNWENPLSSDQYIFLLGMIFIPVTAIVLFIYVYISNQTIDLKKLSWKNIFSFYLPNILFLLAFFIYLINFDPYMSSQLQFMDGVIRFVDKLFLG